MSNTIDLTTEAFLPEGIKQDWLPLNGQSVPHLFKFIRYPPQEVSYHNPPDLRPLLHQEGVSDFNPAILPQLSPPPSQVAERYTAAITAARKPIASFTMVPISGHSVTLPTWVLHYWREIKCAMGYRQSWKEVLKWLEGFSR
jgi:hypothetical protein